MDDIITGNVMPLKKRTPEARAAYLEQKHAEQLVEIARLCQAVQAAEVENQGLIKALSVYLSTLEQGIYNDTLGSEAGQAVAHAKRQIIAEIRAITTGAWEPQTLAQKMEAYSVDKLMEESAALRARLASLETPQNPSICPVEPPVVVSGGDSASGKRYQFCWLYDGEKEVRRGEWVTSRFGAESWVEIMNLEHPGIEHWFEVLP